MQNSFIGIDVSKKKLDICGLFNGKMLQKIVDNSESGFKQLHAWILKKSANSSTNSSENFVEKPHICMEATCCYSEAIADFFFVLGFKVSVVNPLRIKSFRKTKMIRRLRRLKRKFEISFVTTQS